MNTRHATGSPDEREIAPLMTVLREAQKAVPAVKYALGVAGIAAAAGIVNIVLGHTRASVISIGLMFVAMIILFVFSRLVANRASASVMAAANVLLWVVVGLVSVAMILCLTAVAFGVPKGMHDFLLPEKELSNASLIERVMLQDTVDDARDAMDELAKRCPNNCDDKQKIVQAIQYSLRHTPKTERELKVGAIAALRKIVGRNLNDVLSNEFEGVHVVEVDFSRADLSQVSFHQSFAILDNFTFATLDRVDMSESYLRGSDFKNARFSRTNMSGADWYNSFNLDVDQLKDMQGLARCPAPYADRSLKPFIEANNRRYKFQFEEYSSDEKAALMSSWERYARPGGACEFVERPG